MSDRIVIKSSDSSALVELFAPSSSGTFRAHLKGCGFEGTVDVYAYELPTHFAAFFRDLAAHWRGWSGKKRWESIEHQLALTATSDSTGHIRLVIELVGGPLHGWRVGGALLLEAGQLDGLADQVERFFGVGHAA